MSGATVQGAIDFWTSLHEEAFARLSGKWKKLGRLKSERLQPVVFDDLVVAGVADRLYLDILHHDRLIGHEVHFRAGTGITERRETVEP